MQTAEKQITGLAFTGEDFTPENVELTIENGIITDIIPSRAKTERCILPAFFNSHIHTGDTAALDTPADRPLKELVAPPDGLKHRILRMTPEESILKGMKNSIAYMKLRGTLGFADFREGGVHGAELLERAADPEMYTIILGRDGGEHHPASAGLGLSSAHGTVEEKQAADKVRRAGKLLFVHAGEGKTTDIDAAFDLRPDVIIHGTNFRDADIRRAADEDIAVAVCPRSNWTLHVASSRNNPPVRKLLEAGVPLLLGTDNVMFVSPDMFAECAFLINVYDVTPEDALRAATAGFSFAGEKTGIEKGKPANLTIIEGIGLFEWSRHPLKTALVRVGAAAVTEVISSKRQNSSL
ncbi:MAG TPA: amidohydrolase family protein [Methanocorpusculum sp.]|nr:amidohydrolase family protein [Methanocorpusculum sp.]